jgi:low temperature requirement protein LtrA
MVARRRDEEHRTATPLELFFDLFFVVAVAQAGALLAHDIADDHVAHGLASYLLVFFAIWWAWMNFTWFASAYDCDDALYRLATMVQMTGVLVLAAGIPRAFTGDFTVAVVGYVIMRAAQAGQWLRAARGERGSAQVAAVRFAYGLTIVQVAWVLLLLVPDGLWTTGFLLLVAVELAIPAYAERAHPTSWHPRHIAERYGLFTIIVLGETVAAATLAVRSALDEAARLDDLLPIIVGGLLVVFSAFWIYFAVPIHERLVSNRQGFLWGYGHYFVFGSAAAIGAGLEVAVLEATGHAHISPVVAGAAVTVPTALFLLTVWLLHARYFKPTLAQQLVLPVAGGLVLAVTVAGQWAVLLAGVVTAAAVTVGVALAASRPRVGSGG